MCGGSGFSFRVWCVHPPARRPRLLRGRAARFFCIPREGLPRTLGRGHGRHIAPPPPALARGTRVFTRTRTHAVGARARRGVGVGGWVVKPPAAVRAARGRDASEGLRPTEGRRRRVRGVGGPGKSRFPPSLVAGGWTGGMRREGCGERSSGAPPAPSPSAFPGRSRPPLSALPAREARPAAASPAPPAPLPGAGAAAPVRSHRMWREAVRCWRLGEAERDGP